MKIQFRIYHLWDSHGGECAVLAEDSSDTVSTYNLRDGDGNQLQFESEAYHLKLWAKGHGLGYAVHDQEVEVNKPKDAKG